MERKIFWLLKLLCPDHLYEEIEGDLIQKFNREVRVVGERKAKRRLMWNAIRFLRPGILLRNKFSLESNFIAMIFPIGILILIVLITSSFQIIKAANSNPVDHLKNE